MGERQGVVRLEARLRCARSDLLSRIERYQEGPRSDHQDRSAATGHPCYGRKAVVYFQMNRRFSTQNICASQPSYARKRGEGVETVNRKTRSGPSRDLRARACVWDRSADHISASGDASRWRQARRPHTWLHPNASQNDRLLLHRGLRPYMALGVVLTVIALAQIALHA